MLRRLVTVAFVVLFAGAPVATELCNAACAASEAAQSTDTAVAHHSCESMPPLSGPAVSGVPHACGHADNTPDGLDNALQRLTLPAIVPAIVVFEWPLVRTYAAHRLVADSPPPLARLSQLRV